MRQIADFGRSRLLATLGSMNIKKFERFLNTIVPDEHPARELSADECADIFQRVRQYLDDHRVKRRHQIACGERLISLFMASWPHGIPAAERIEIERKWSEALGVEFRSGRSRDTTR